MAFTPLIWYLWNGESGGPVNGGNTQVLDVVLRMIGTNSVLTFTFLDIFGDPVDPFETLLVVMFPDETLQEYVPDRISTGIYALILTTPLVGLYYYTFYALEEVDYPIPVYPGTDAL